MLQSMTIRLIHVDQLETLYLCYGVKYESRVIWGHCGQKVVFNKNTITRPCYISWPLKTHTCWSAWDPLPMLWSQISIWGLLGSQQRLCPDLFTDLVSSSSSSSSSSFFFCQHFSDLYLGHHLTDFNQTWSQVPVDHPTCVTWPD